MASSLEYRARRADHIARGLCARCNAPATKGQHCDRHAEYRRKLEEKKRGLIRGHTAGLRMPHGNPDYVPTHHCKECSGLAHRRPLTGCPTCGGEFREDTIEAP